MSSTPTPTLTPTPTPWVEPAGQALWQPPPPRLASCPRALPSLGWHHLTTAHGRPMLLYLSHLAESQFCGFFFS